VGDARVRVTFCIDNLGLGGTELNAVRLAERLDRSRFALRVVSLQADGPLADRYRAVGVPLDVFSPGQLLGRKAMGEGLRLRKHLRRHGIEIFHAHDPYSNLFGCPWARLAGAKVIASRRWMGAPLPGHRWRLASGMPYRVAHVSLANSPRVGEMLERFDGVPTQRIAVVPNFVGEDAFVPLQPALRRRLCEELGLSGEGPTVGVVANLRPVKDHATLLRAVALIRPRWPGIRTVLVGDGESREELQRLGDQLGIGERTIFAGRRANEPNLNHLFDISVLCSKREGLPNAVLEAMAAGKPVVATDVGGVADAVVDGETGLLVPASDPDRFAAALDALLSDSARARRLGEAGRKRAQAMYSPQAALGALEAVYMGLVRRSPVNVSQNAQPEALVRD
jgi:glycosyltransferase involved in cell wall biosynthesis